MVSEHKAVSEPTAGSEPKTDSAAVQVAPTLPAFGKGCITEVLPYLLPGRRGHGELPVEIGTAPKRVLLVLDGLGWWQLSDRQHLAPTLTAMEGGPITTVAPSTTATALTSITTSLTPGEHGLLGYRMVVDGQVLNTLRWGGAEVRDARTSSPPEVIQPFDPFQGEDVALVSRADFARSGFSAAHLRGSRLIGYRTTATLVHEVARLLREGEQFVYAYYDGIDKVAHEYGLHDVYNAELCFVDRLVAELLEAVPYGTEVVVTADHGQVDCADGLVKMHPEVAERCTGLSGEGRFRWLHTQTGATEDLVAAATEHHGEQCWVVTREQMVEEHWFGPVMRHQVEDRLGDVALLPFEPIAYFDPEDSGPFELIGRHGSLTEAEMMVPLLRAHS